MCLRVDGRWICTLVCLVMCGCWPQRPNKPASYFEPTEIALKEVSGKNLKELTDERLVFVDTRGVKWTAPRGTYTDGASVPRLLLAITDDRWQKEFLKAAVVHDAYCQEFNEERCREQYRKKHWREVHHMFYEACLAGGTSETKAKLMFAGVWLGGPKWGDDDRTWLQVPAEIITIAYLGCADWIQRKNPDIDEIVIDADQRADLVEKVYESQLKTLSAVRKSDWNKANRLLREEEMLLEQGTKSWPDDLMLHNLQGYWFKNKAMVTMYGGKNGDVDGQLAAAEEAFQKVLKSAPGDPSAHNGLGSVAILRRDWNAAEKHVLKALEIAPDYQAAQNDLEIIRRSRSEEL